MILKEQIAEVILSEPSLTNNEEIQKSELVIWVARELEARFRTKLADPAIKAVIDVLSSHGVLTQRAQEGILVLRPTYKCFVPDRPGEPSVVVKAFSLYESHVKTVDENASDLLIQSPSPSTASTDPIDSLEDLTGLVAYPYKASLTSRIERLNERDRELVQYAPYFFDVLSDMLTDNYIDWHTRIMISTALGYLVLQRDIISDHLRNGLVDDTFIMVYVLREIKQRFSIKAIEPYWQHKEEAGDLIEGVFHQCCCTIPPSTALEILQMVGLHKFRALNLEEYTGSYQKRLAKLGNEKRELLALLAFVIKKMDNVDVKGMKVDKIKNYLQQSGDFSEITRLIEISKTGHDFRIKRGDQFEEEFNSEMNKAMREALFKKRVQ